MNQSQGSACQNLGLQSACDSSGQSCAHPREVREDFLSPSARKRKSSELSAGELIRACLGAVGTQRMHGAGKGREWEGLAAL